MTIHPCHRNICGQHTRTSRDDGADILQPRPHLQPFHDRDAPIVCSQTKHHQQPTTVAASMNSSNQLKTAVENIRDELQRIMAVEDLQKIEASVASEEFKTRLIGEFNVKLRGFKSKVRALNEENGRLRKRITELERALPLFPRELNAKRRRTDWGEKEDGDKNQPQKSLDFMAHWETARGQRPKPLNPTDTEQIQSLIPHNRNHDPSENLKDTSAKHISKPSNPDGKDRDENNKAEETEVLILSSPLKSPLRSPLKLARDLTSSQFNRLPTQYSDELRDTQDAGETLGRENRRSGLAPLKSVQLAPAAADPLGLSPVAVAFAESQEVVADSQEEMEPLAQAPAHYTSLQRTQFLRNYFRMKLADSGFCVALALNPITEHAWVADDFKRNSRWAPPAVAPSRARAMTKAQESVYREFFREAGFGARTGGPQWGDSDGDDESAPEDVHGPRSQVMDKYLSPPGYMVGLFPSTQEALDRKAEVQRKATERLERRLASALSGGEFVFYEDVLNTYVAQGRYTRGAV